MKRIHSVDLGQPCAAGVSLGRVDVFEGLVDLACAVDGIAGSNGGGKSVAFLVG